MFFVKSVTVNRSKSAREIVVRVLSSDRRPLAIFKRRAPIAGLEWR